AIKSLTATPRTISDSTRISYTLTAPATVTATLRDAGGGDVATLFTQQHQPGKQTFKFVATTAPEGHFQLVLTAANAKTSVSATVPVVIDRTVTRFAVSPPVTNGDITFSFQLERVAAVKLDIQRAGKTIAPVYSATLPPGAQSVGWTAAGTKDGTYAGALTTSGEVGTVCTSGGSCSAVWFAFTPMPSTTRPPLDSARIPATFLPPSRTSFGNLIAGSRPVASAIAWATAPPATRVSSGRRGGSTS